MRNCVLQQRKSGSNNEKKKFDLSSSIFTETELAGTIFFLCELKGVNFQKANLENVVFDKCNLKEANLTNANIRGTNFTDSRMENTILDIEGFVIFGNSKGFILEQQNIEKQKISSIKNV
jgi:uncharacterized protein YjbI with pentapeptide repeats